MIVMDNQYFKKDIQEHYMKIIKIIQKIINKHIQV